MILSPEILQKFQPIALEEMGKAELMNRKDTKFYFPSSHLSKVLDELTSTYKILEVKGQRITSYQNIYFDTKDHLLYLSHHNGRLNRYKIRIRSYGNDGPSFLEVKFKSNQGRTIKNRLNIPQGTFYLTDACLQFISTHTPLPAQDLTPTVKISFNRITLVSRDLTERATIDIGLTAEQEDRKKSFTELAIAELKQEGIISGSLFKAVLRENHGREQRLSKYCICFSALNPEVKQNRFKMKHHLITKLQKQHQHA